MEAQAPFVLNGNLSFDSLALELYFTKAQLEVLGIDPLCIWITEEDTSTPTSNPLPAIPVHPGKPGDSKKILSGNDTRTLTIKPTEYLRAICNRCNVLHLTIDIVVLCY